MKKLVGLVLVFLLCITLIPAVGCGREAGLGLTSEEIEWLGLTEQDLEELKNEMMAEEWEGFVKEVKADYKAFRESKPSEDAEPVKKPEEGKRLEPIAMLPDKFPGFCLGHAPNKIVMRLEIEGMIAGAIGLYGPTKGGGYEDTVAYIHLCIIEFPDENIATMQLKVMVDEAREKEQQGYYKEIDYMNPTEAVIATGDTCTWRDPERATIMHGVMWPEFDRLHVHDRYLIVVSIGDATIPSSSIIQTSKICGEQGPWPTPSDIQHAFFATLDAIRF